MRVAVTGSSGLLGSALAGALRGRGDEAVPVVRRAAGAGEIAWDPAAGSIDRDGLAGVDAVVHLAGAGIGDKRWTAARRELIRASRVDSTELLTRTMIEIGGPRTLLSGSAIGYYGDRGDEILDETSGPGTGFLAELCVDWEAAAAPAAEQGIRTVLLRTGIVQSPDGGALARALPLFRFGLGGPFGAGEQWWSWISVDDHVGAMLHLLDGDVEGPVNLVAPEPVTNRDHAKALGAALHRPAILPVPRFGPMLLLGREATDEVLFASQRLRPTVLEQTGFAFRHRTIEECLQAVLSTESA